MSSSGLATNDDSFPPSTKEQRSNRACEACRLLKVRCLLDDASSTSQCQRCLRAKRPCVFAAPQKRRPRKRTDTRVAELEREVRAMRLLLRDTDSPLPDSSRQRDRSIDEEDEAYAMIESVRHHTFHPAPRSSGLKSTADKGGAASSLSATLDVVDRGIVSMETATKLVAVYVDDLVQHYPIVVLPQEITASELRQSRPALFLAVIAAAALGINPKTSFTLNQELIRLYADRIFIVGEKSLELVQALLVSVLYYHRLDSDKQLQYYQYTHVAATMALDIGIGSAQGAHRGNPNATVRAERCRTLLSCYLLTAALATRMRRSNMLLFNNWMGECLDLLEKSPAVLDKRLAAWVKLQRIADRAAASFGFDDPSVGICLSNMDMQAILKDFEQQMEEWKATTAPEILNVSMTIDCYQNSITVYEFAMDGSKHDANEFKHQHFTLPILTNGAIDLALPPSNDVTDGSQARVLLSAAQIDATTKCVQSVHGLLDAFLTLGTKDLQIVPNVLFVRAAHAIFTLLKISFARDLDRLEDVIIPQDLKVDFYLQAVRQTLTRATAVEKHAVPSAWLEVMIKLQEWHRHYQAQLSQRRSQDQVATRSAKSLHNFRGQGFSQMSEVPYTSTEDTNPSIVSSAGHNFFTNNSLGPHEQKLVFENGQKQMNDSFLPEAGSFGLPDFLADFGQLGPFSLDGWDMDFGNWTSNENMLTDANYNSTEQGQNMKLG